MFIDIFEKQIFHMSNASFVLDENFVFVILIF